MNSILEKYGYTPSEEKIGRSIELVAANLEGVKSSENYRKCFGLMDLTTLRAQDTPEYVAALVDKVNSLDEKWPGYPQPASICVYPNFAPVVANGRRHRELGVTCVAGCFPASQSFIEVKALECAMAVENGADEIDIVLALNSFLAGDLEAAAAEIRAMREAVDTAAEKQGRRVVLKVILETGLLITPEKIAAASFIAMENGADFIKTSTGKVDVNATPAAAYVMCECIKRYYEVTGRKVGFKAAGGVSAADDAICYYGIVRSILGEEWLNRDLFRFGVSRLGNSIMSAVEGATVTYF